MTPQPLHFAQYRFILRAETTIQLSYYKGSALRGAFGQVFKRMVCLQPPDHPRECPVCPLRRECPYGTTFENALPAVLNRCPVMRVSLTRSSSDRHWIGGGFISVGIPLRLT